MYGTARAIDMMSAVMALPCGSLPLCGSSDMVQIQNSTRRESTFLPSDKYNQLPFSGIKTIISQ